MKYNNNNNKVFKNYYNVKFLLFNKIKKKYNIMDKLIPKNNAKKF